MTHKFIPVEEAFKKWCDDPAYRREYDALEDEFALAAALRVADASTQGLSF